MFSQNPLHHNSHLGTNTFPNGPVDSDAFPNGVYKVMGDAFENFITKNPP